VVEQQELLGESASHVESAAAATAFSAPAATATAGDATATVSPTLER